MIIILSEHAPLPAQSETRANFQLTKILFWDYIVSCRHYWITIRLLYEQLANSLINMLARSLAFASSIILWQ